MDYTSLHVNGHLLSDEILRSIEQDATFLGNRAPDYGIDTTVASAIDYAWSALRNDWRFYLERSSLKDPYGTRRARDLMERLLQNLGYQLQRQAANIVAGGKSYEITYLAHDLHDLPCIVVGDRISEEANIATRDRCSLDYRAKGTMQRKSPHATMLDYLNSTDNVYGIVSNGQTLRLVRNSGQLVKVTYIEFDLRRMLEEDKYAEFCLMFRLIHASRFRTAEPDAPCIMERWFNMSVESGNRIRAGLSDAVKKAMETIGNAAVTTPGEGNSRLREAIVGGDCDAARLNKELIHFIYRLLFLFIIEDRGLVYQLPDAATAGGDAGLYSRQCRSQDIYKRFYQASRLRALSELSHLRQHRYHDLWQGLMDTFRLFEEEEFGSRLDIKPLGGVLFNPTTLCYLKRCTICNDDLLRAFAALNEFVDAAGQRVRINYSSLDVEEFGSVYEGILEMRPYVNAPQSSDSLVGWKFGFVGGLDRQSTSSYYTRPDLVQSLIRTTLQPVIERRLAPLATADEKVRSLLAMRVCDAASGSGHIVLAMARTIAWHVCFYRTGEDNPASLDFRQALHDVIQRCVYAVDCNPDAVELCKVVLWIEGYCAGKPLSFLDHHIRCGNSVVGIADLDVLLNGIPDEAFSGSDKAALRNVRKLNAKAKADVKLLRENRSDSGLQVSLFDSDYSVTPICREQIDLAEKVAEIAALPEDTLSQQYEKQKQWRNLVHSPRVECLRRACDIFTDAFYFNYSTDRISDPDSETVPDFPHTATVYQALEEIRHLDDKSTHYIPLSDAFRREVAEAARRYRFFHWAVEFPEVFANGGGFDVMCGNPPWDKLQMEEEKWFEGKDDNIVKAANQNARKQKIAALATSNPQLYEEFMAASKAIANQSLFVKESGRFPLTAVGKIELSSLFAELCLNFSKEAWGLVLPTGIAVNDTNKAFFSKLIAENRLISLYDFENREKLFDIDSRYKFCLLTAGKAQEKPRTVSGGFYLTRLDHLLDPNRIYSLRTNDFALLNPNTQTCPVFRTSRDAALTAKIYRNAQILVNETTGNDPWGIKFLMLFNMASASSLFFTRKQLEESGATQDGDTYVLGDDTFVPLYEGKMIWLYNHHYGSFPSEYDVYQRPNSIEATLLAELNNPSSCVAPWYWVNKRNVDDRLCKTDKDGNILWHWKHSYYIAFRDVTNATNERTCIASLMPSGCAAGHKAPLVFTSRSLIPSVCFLAMLSSLVFDYIARQKVGGSSMSFFIMKQLPVLTPEQIPAEWEMPIVERVAELCYFNHDLDGWAEELWQEMTLEQRDRLPHLGAKQPYRYDPDRRATLQAELDAIFAHLYGLSTDDLRYILQPEDICGEGCINETFRVLRDRELRQHGEYRTRRLVLDAWHRFHFDL